LDTSIIKSLINRHECIYYGGEPLKELNNKQSDYLQWLLLPDELKFPQTKTAYAKHVGITVNTLGNWEKLPQFESLYKDGVAELAQSPERTQRLLDSLYKRGLGGDTRSAQLYLQATGALNKESTLTVKTAPTSTLTDAELQSLIAEYAQVEAANREHRAANSAQIEDDDKKIAELEKVIKDSK